MIHINVVVAIMHGPTQGPECLKAGGCQARGKPRKPWSVIIKKRSVIMDKRLSKDKGTWKLLWKINIKMNMLMKNSK